MKNQLSHEDDQLLLALALWRSAGERGRLTIDDVASATRTIELSLALAERLAKPEHHELAQSIVVASRKLAAALEGTLELSRLDRGGATRQ